MISTMNVDEQTRKRIISEYMSEIAKKNGSGTRGFHADAENAARCAKMKNPRKGFGSLGKSAASEAAKARWAKYRAAKEAALAEAVERVRQLREEADK